MRPLTVIFVSASAVIGVMAMLAMSSYAWWGDAADVAAIAGFLQLYAPGLLEALGITEAPPFAQVGVVTQVGLIACYLLDLLLEVALKGTWRLVCIVAGAGQAEGLRRATLVVAPPPSP